MSQPNILLFVSDQHRADFIEGEGDSQVSTSNLRRLADRGTVFERCLTTCPLCVPARMSLITGRSPHNLDSFSNASALHSQIPTFAHALGMAGYRTVLAGRMHFMGGDQFHGFDERLVGDVCGGHMGQNRAEYRFRGYYGQPPYIDGDGAGLSHDQYFDQAVAVEACRLIRDHEVAKDERPLLLVLGFYSPHDPYRVRDKFFRKYRGKGDLPEFYKGEGKLHTADRYLHELCGWDKLPEEAIREARSGYRGKTEFLDDLIGQVIECFEESPIGDNGVIAYTSDHGDMLGDHGIWGKSRFYEEAVRVPLIVAGPGIETGRIKQAVSLMDIAPTLADLAGAKPIPAVKGVSLVPSLRGEDAPARQIFSELDGCKRMVVDGKWKYIYYHNESSCLFNLADDPGELNDLAGSSGLADLEAKLKEAIFADGWNVERNLKHIEEMKVNQQYIGKWAQKVEVKDPVQWGLPAEL